MCMKLKYLPKNHLPKEVGENADYLKPPLLQIKAILVGGGFVYIIPPMCLGGVRLAVSSRWKMPKKRQRKHYVNIHVS